MLERLNAWRRDRRQAREQQALEELKARYHAFRVFLENNGQALQLIGLFDSALLAGDDDAVRRLVAEMHTVGAELVDGLNMVSGHRHQHFYAIHQRLFELIGHELRHLDDAPARVPMVVPLATSPPGLLRQIGTKAATLNQLIQAGLPVPDGFAVTTAACRRFLETAGLESTIRNRLDALRNRPDDLAAAAAEIRQRIAAAALPDDLAAALHTAWRELRGNGTQAISVRSSALAEDRPEHSFAGQFDSVLNVTDPDALLAAYRQVISSGFNNRAIAYRLKAHLPLADLNMAVLCQGMVAARCAGVLLSRDPAFPDSERMLVSAVPGLGTSAVGGTSSADLYRPSRNGEDLNWSEALIASKEVAEIAAQGGGLKQVPVPLDRRDQALLSAAELTELVQCARRIETLEGLPQDIEWAIDHSGALHILQARPLRLTAAAPHRPLASATGKLLASGLCASPGKAVGRAQIVRLAQELETSVPSGPEPRILLLPQGIVEAAPHLCDFEGVIVDVGNPADHLSCIAREYAIPMVTGMLTAADAITEGSWLVVDADRGRVYEAPQQVWADYAGHGRPAPSKRTVCAPIKMSDPLRDRLKQLIVPLNLTDAYGATFSLAEYRSFHDLVRLLHESAVMAMFSAGDSVMEGAGTLLRKVDIGIPFHFLVIDLGGGLVESSRRGGNLGLKDIRSVPLTALCRGLTTPGLSWHAPPQAGAISGLFSRTLLDAGSARPVGEFNYALAARDYLNLNARVEFHFANLDAVCSAQAQANYIRFRFKGGGTGTERCRRRAHFISEVLEANGFVSTVVGDLVTAALVGAPRAIVDERLVMLGRLLGFTRLLDAVMDDDETPRRLAHAFLAGNYSERTLPQPTHPQSG